MRRVVGPQTIGGGLLAAALLTGGLALPAAAGAATPRKCPGSFDARSGASGLAIGISDIRARRGFSCASAKTLIRSWARHSDRIGSGGFSVVRGRYCIGYDYGRRVRCTRSHRPRGASGPTIVTFATAFDES